MGRDKHWTFTCMWLWQNIRRKYIKIICRIYKFLWYCFCNSGNEPSTILQCTNLNAITNAECEPEFPPDVVTNKVLCTATSNVQSTCFGDSGGPLTHGTRWSPKESLVGLTSFGKSLCEQNSPVGFVRISKYLDWIHTHSGVKCRRKMSLTDLFEDHA